MRIINSKIFLIFSLISLVALSINQEAFAAEDTSFPEVVDGIPTVYLIAGIAIAGILLHTYKDNIGTSLKDIDKNQLIYTIMISSAASAILVGNAFQNVSSEINDSALMIYVIQQIMTVAGAKYVTDLWITELKNPY